MAAPSDPGPPSDARSGDANRVAARRRKRNPGEENLADAAVLDRAASAETQAWADKNSPVMPVAELVREVASRVLRQRIQDLGVDGSGAYEHYFELLMDGFPIPPYQIAVVEFVQRHLPNLRGYDEIGSSLGTLPFMLALSGFPSMGIEPFDPRHAAALDIRRELKTYHASIESTCALRCGTMPDVIDGLDVSNALAIATDLTPGKSDEERHRFYGGLRRYRYLLVDLRQFCEPADGQEEKAEIVSELRSLGYTSRSENIDLGGDGFFRLFENESVELQETANRTTSDFPARPSQPGGGRDSDLVTMPPGGVPAAARESVVPESPIQATLLSMLRRPQRLKRSRFGGLVGLSALLVIGLPTLIGSIYYGFIASNQYVSEFEFAVRSPPHVGGASIGGAGGLGAMIGMSDMTMMPDAHIVTEYINSRQAMTEVDKDIDLRKLFSDRRADFVARLDPTVSTEQMEKYWQGMVGARFDLLSGIVSVSVRAFSPEDSLRISDAIVKRSDAMFATLNRNAQNDLVKSAEAEVAETEAKLTKAREAVLDFRIKSGVFDPGKAAAGNTFIMEGMRGELARLKAQYDSDRTFVAPGSPQLQVLESRIAALENQIPQVEQRSAEAPKVGKDASPTTVARYEALELEYQFAGKLYTAALEILQRARATAQQKDAYLVLFVKPTLAEASLYPNRLRSIAVIVLAAAAAWFVGLLVTYSIRDHLT